MFYKKLIAHDPFEWTRYNNKQNLMHYAANRAFHDFPLGKAETLPLNIDFVLPGKQGYCLCDSWSTLTAHALALAGDPDVEELRLIENRVNSSCVRTPYSPRPGDCCSEEDEEDVFHIYIELHMGGHWFVLDRTICQFPFARRYPFGVFSRVESIPDEIQRYYKQLQRRILSKEEVLEQKAAYYEYSLKGLIEKARLNDNDL